jgi:hypothetical protein
MVRGLYLGEAVPVEGRRRWRRKGSQRKRYSTVGMVAAWVAIFSLREDRRSSQEWVRIVLVNAASVAGLRAMLRSSKTRADAE